MAQLISINGVTNLITPSLFDIEEYDVTNAERNAQADMLIDLIAKKNKVVLEWQNIHDSEVRKIKNALSPLIFNISYHEPGVGVRTLKVYKGNRTFSMYNYNGGNPIWGSVKVNLIQI